MLHYSAVCTNDLILEPIIMSDTTCDIILSGIS